jgi:hypothetical protein
MCKMPSRLGAIMKVIGAMYGRQILAYVVLFMAAAVGTIVAAPNDAVAKCVVKGWTNDRNSRPIFKCHNGPRQYRARRGQTRRSR